MNMIGTIPDSLYYLRNLKALHLRNNEPGFWGTAIKSTVGKLVNLKELVLNNNPLLEGTVPPELGLCNNLSKSFVLWLFLFAPCFRTLMSLLSLPSGNSTASHSNKWNCA